MWQDYVNAAWEALGCMVLGSSIRQLVRDESVRGIHWSHVAYSVGISAWFCYYYAHLDQWWSAGVQVLFTAETVLWAVLMLWYFAAEVACGEDR